MTTTKQATERLFRLAARTPFNIAPERSKAFATEVLGTEQWQLHPSETEANFYAVVSDHAIYLSYAGLASLWCLSFTAYCVTDLSSRAARDPDIAKQGVIDFGECWARLNLGAYVDFARRLIKADEVWPDALAAPDVTADLSSIEGRVNNLFFGALSWMFLHEIAHVHHGDSKFISASMRVDQEYRADEFATDWVLADAGNGLHNEFRVLAVAVALAWLFLHEQAKGPAPDHPAAILRFREAVAKFDVGNRSVALENATYMLKAIFDPESDMPRGLSAREAFDWVCARLEAQFAGSA